MGLYPPGEVEIVKPRFYSTSYPDFHVWSTKAIIDLRSVMTSNTANVSIKKNKLNQFFYRKEEVENLIPLTGVYVYPS